MLRDTHLMSFAEFENSFVITALGFMVYYGRIGAIDLSVWMNEWILLRPAKPEGALVYITSFASFALSWSRENPYKFLLHLTYTKY